LLKRGLKGTYVSVEPFHLFRYLDEQAFRYNNRKDMDDRERFQVAVSQIVGKRLTYKALTGKDGDFPDATLSVVDRGRGKRIFASVLGRAFED
jgi:hypothetical protein